MAREELSGNSALFFISIWYDTDIRFNFWNDDLENLKD